MTTSIGTTWQAESSFATLRELPQGVDAWYDAAVGHISSWIPRKHILLKRAERVLAMEDQFSSITDDELKTVIEKLSETFRFGREDDDIVNKALAIIREVCWRTLKMKPYKVQVAGGLSIETGTIAEMSTGEGKTLTATLPGVIAGWRGRGCHVMTSNEYLAERDAEEMSPVYNFCGLSVDCLTGKNDDDDRRRAYQADITYCTNKDVAADFLRDQLAHGHGSSRLSSLLQDVSGLKPATAKKPVLRGLACAIVDEADSVLIDDGVTPLLISGESNKKGQAAIYVQAKQFADQYKQNEHYKVDEQYKEIILLDKGKELLEHKRTSMGGVWTGQVRARELLNQALNVRHFFIRNKQYIIDEGKVVIVDEATGRLMPDRFWRSGTHQAVEAKENVEINADKETYARISFQKFFRFYHKLSGMTGTAREARKEFWFYFHRNIVPIPTNRPCIRKQRRPKVYSSDTHKWKAVVDEAEKIHADKRPVLIGTGSIRDSHTVSDLLTERGLKHQVLNAIHHAREAEIVSRAGQESKITVATNMAGRGTDIKLTDVAREHGGLHVIATERFDSYRIDRQLYGRSSRQGDPGSAVALLSLDDLLLRRYGKVLRFLSKIISPFCSFKGRMGLPGIRLIYWGAQRRSVHTGRVMRKSVMQSDDWLENTLGFAGKG